MIKFYMSIVLVITYLSYCLAAFPFRRIPQRLNELYYIPSIEDDPDAMPNGILLNLYDDHFGSRFQITNEYGTSRSMPINKLPIGYIDEHTKSHNFVNTPKKRKFRKTRKNFPQKTQRLIQIIHENAPSDLDETVINNEILRYFSLANFGPLDDEIFSFK